MNVKFLIAMLYSGVFLLFTGVFGFIWASSIIGDFIVGAGSAQLSNANLNIPTFPLVILATVGLSLVIMSISLSLKAKRKEAELALSNA
jgi:hypothetical protein